MDYSAVNKSFAAIEIAAGQSAEQTIDTQISLPEYCEDIRKILRCFVRADITSSGITGDRASADGEAVIRVLYVGESGKPGCYEQSVPFSAHIGLNVTQNDYSLKVSAETQYVNCRAVSQRRISVSAGMSVHFCVRRICSEKIFSGSDNPGFETKCEMMSCSVPCAVCDKAFDMSETAALPDSLSPVSSVIRTNTCAVIDTIKTVTDKMLIKGDMITDILYFSDTDDCKTEKYRHSMPISQIIDLDGIDENSLCCVDITVLSVCVSPKADSEGNNKLLDISVRALASVTARNECEICVVGDGYSTEYETESEYKDITFQSHILTYKEAKQVRGTFDVSAQQMAEIMDVYPLSCSGSAQGGPVINGSGEIPFGILYKDTEGEYGYTEKTCDFSFECRSRDGCEKISAMPAFTVTESSAALTSSSSAEIRMTVLISMPVYEETHKKVCTKLDIIEEKHKAPCECPLTIYFPSENEKLWDIAKRYNTTCEIIREENELTGDETGDKKMILISSI